MELQYYGANCVRITTKKASLLIDDNLKQLGLKDPAKPTDVVINTHKIDVQEDVKMVLDMPGEYEISGVSITGIGARAHMDEANKKTAVIYKIEADELKLVVLGHVYPDLNDDQLEQIGMVDILIVPVGNSGYTLDGVGALKVIKKIEPKIVIPTHYADKAVKYEVPQQELAEALKTMSMEPSEEPVAKYKAKAAELTDTTKLVILERQ